MVGVVLSAALVKATADARWEQWREVATACVVLPPDKSQVISCLDHVGIVPGTTS